MPILQCLVDRGASVNDTLWANRPELAQWARVEASTPLIDAAAVGNIDSVRVFLDYGANRTKSVVEFGKLPLELAVACETIEVNGRSL